MYRDEWRVLFREGSVSQRSTEYFLRYRGTEYSVSLADMDGQTWVLAHVWSYPNVGGRIDGATHSFYAALLDKVKEMQKENPDLGLWKISEEIPEKKFGDLTEQGKSLPVCPHCGRIWD